jgi:hypothetical protein
MSRKNEKVKIISGLIASVLVVLGLALYAMNIDAINPMEMGTGLIALLLVAGATYVFWTRMKSYRKGLPAEDEFSKKVNYKAGYYGFIAAIWSSVFIGWMEPLFVGMGLEFRHGPTMVLLVTGFVFIVSYIWMSRRGSAG